jgi:hypothetical protein
MTAHQPQDAAVLRRLLPAIPVTRRADRPAGSGAVAHLPGHRSRARHRMGAARRPCPRRTCDAGPAAQSSLWRIPGRRRHRPGARAQGIMGPQTIQSRTPSRTCIGRCVGRDVRSKQRSSTVHESNGGGIQAPEVSRHPRRPAHIGSANRQSAAMIRNAAPPIRAYSRPEASVTSAIAMPTQSVP